MPRGKPGDTITIEPNAGDAKPNSISDIANNLLNAADTDNRDASGTIIIDPAIISGPGNGSDEPPAGEPAKKRRGRKPGSTNNASAKKTSALDVNGVEALLFSMHNLLASVAQTNELALDKTESQMLAQGIANVARHYDLGATQKSLDWANLIQCLLLIYGTRFYAIRMRVQKEKRDKDAASSMTSVHHVPGAA